jgi:1-acyl-sn-glycerol-3-phosphate acyltransferase
MWYCIFRSIFRLLLKIFFRFKVEGVENLPQKTNFIVAANHSSFLDPPALGAAIPKRIYWLTSRGLYRVSWLKWFFRKINAMPTWGSSERAFWLLKNNKNIGLFPEGRRSFDGKLNDFRRGAALLAVKTGRPIVPCAIIGTYEALPRTRRVPRLVSLKVRIGKPLFLLKEFEDRIDELRLQEGIFQVRETIKEMLDAG